MITEKEKPPQSKWGFFKRHREKSSLCILIFQGRVQALTKLKEFVSKCTGIAVFGTSLRQGNLFTVFDLIPSSNKARVQTRTKLGVIARNPLNINPRAAFLGARDGTADLSIQVIKPLIPLLRFSTAPVIIKPLIADEVIPAT